MTAAQVLVTGASGFVGRGLVRRLAAEPGFIVQALNRVERAIDRSSAQITRWENIPAGASHVIHLAARVHIMQDTAGDPLAEFRASNVDGTLRLAREAAQAGVQRFVFLSSVKVNGEESPHGKPFSETATPAPQDPYGVSKFEAELGLQKIALETGMEIVIIRPPLVYGPQAKANFASLMRAIARGIPLPLGALHNRRSLVGLDNLVDFITTCTTHPAAANQVFFVSDGEDLSTSDLARRLGASLHRPARLIPVPPAWLMAGATLFNRRSTAERLCGDLQVDITKARTRLNWTPPASVDEGFRRAAAEHKHR